MTTSPTPPDGEVPATRADARAGSRADARADARAYALAVRAHLDDLGPDVVEELTGGLEADLGDLAAESATPLAERLGGPAAYAAELRSAAGLRPRAVSAPRAPRRGVVEGLRADLLEGWGETTAGLRRQAWWPYAADLGRTLRPAWWLLRAWVVGVLLFSAAGARSGVLPGSPGALLALLALAWASVELGRGRWALRGRLPAALAGANAVAAIALLPLLAGLGSGGGSSSVQYVTSTDAPTPAPTGLVLDGEAVSNLFPYDAQGNPLTGVQILDDRGRPVTTGEESRQQWDADGGHPFVPGLDADGRVRWNAYPLRRSRSGDGAGAPTDAPRPVPTVPALLAPPTATATASPSPTATATGSPSATASAGPPASPPTTAPPAPTTSQSPTTVTTTTAG